MAHPPSCLAYYRENHEHAICTCLVMSIILFILFFYLKMNPTYWCYLEPKIYIYILLYDIVDFKNKLFIFNF